MDSGKHGRRWIIPPAILRGPGETIDRLPIIGEHDEPTGLLLWRLVRTAELWADTPFHLRNHPHETRAARSRAAMLRTTDLPAELRDHLRYLNGLLGWGKPREGIADRIATACSRVAQWARGIGARETAVAFAQAAALASPHDPKHAWLTGVCSREAGQLPRAWSWLLRAVGLARRARDARASAESYLALGEIAETEGAPRKARRMYAKSFRAARRQRQRCDLRAASAFAGLRLARAMGDAAAAEHWAREATRAVLRLGDGCAESALDLANHWVARGRAEPALRLLDHLRRIDVLAPVERLTASLLRVHALLLLGDTERARRAWEVSWRCAERSPDATPALLLGLARAAMELGDLHGLALGGRAALTRAGPAEYPDLLHELRRIADGRVDFGPPIRRPAP